MFKYSIIPISSPLWRF